MRTYTQHKLESMGVGAAHPAVDMDDDSITVKGPNGVETSAPAADLAAGVAASPLAKLLADKAGLEDRAARIPVEIDCTLAGHPVFAVGDMVSLNNLP